jgi:hypothetical protein
MLANREYDQIAEFIQPDCVHDYPQSGERIVGIANIRSVFENYPGGLGQQDMETFRVAGDNQRWAMAPNFTLVSLTGGGNSYSSVVRARYPDGTDWFVVTMFELVDGRQSHASLFFAPLFEAPEWRRPYTEAGADS